MKKIDFQIDFLYQPPPVPTVTGRLTLQRPLFFGEEVCISDIPGFQCPPLYVAQGSSEPFSKLCQRIDADHRLWLIKCIIDKYKILNQLLIPDLQRTVIWWTSQVRLEGEQHTQTIQIDLKFNKDYLLKDTKFKKIGSITDCSRLDQKIKLLEEAQSTIDNFDKWILDYLISEVMGEQELKYQDYQQALKLINERLDNKIFFLETNNKEKQNEQSILIGYLRHEFDYVLSCSAENSIQKIVKAHTLYCRRRLKQSQSICLNVIKEVQNSKNMISVLFLLTRINIERHQIKQAEIYCHQLFNCLALYDLQLIPAMPFIIALFKIRMLKQEYGQLIAYIRELLRIEVKEELVVIMSITLFMTHNYRAAYEFIQHNQVISAEYIGVILRIQCLLEYHVSTTSIGFCYAQMNELLKQKQSALKSLWIWRPAIRQLIFNKNLLKSKYEQVYKYVEQYQDYDQTLYVKQASVKYLVRTNQSSSVEQFMVILSRLQTINQSINSRQQFKVYQTQLLDMATIVKLSKYSSILWFYKYYQLNLRISIKTQTNIAEHSNKLLNYLLQHQDAIYNCRQIIIDSVQYIIDAHIQYNKCSEALEMLNTLQNAMMLPVELILKIAILKYLLNDISDALATLDRILKLCQPSDALFVSVRLYKYLIDLERQNHADGFKYLYNSYTQFVIQNTNCIKGVPKQEMICCLIYSILYKYSQQESKSCVYLRKTIQKIEYTNNQLEMYIILSQLCFQNKSIKQIQNIQQNHKPIYTKCLPIIQVLMNISALRDQLNEQLCQELIQTLSYQIQKLPDKFRWLYLLAKAQYQIKTKAYFDIAELLYLIENKYNRHRDPLYVRVRAAYQLSSYQKTKDSRKLEMASSLLGSSKQDKKLVQQISQIFNKL